ncbi:MAG TPA: hypothetical protein VKD65_10115 [Candidatus Angelobacter sp.]|nr:hypothetical protein [Candidatus Angelobacter sp.]
MKVPLIIFLAVLVLQGPQSHPQSSSAPSDSAAVREQGRRVFTDHCGKCHDENARKKLSDGSTLLTRLSATKDPPALLGTRLKSMSAEDRRAVLSYVEDLLSQFRSSEKK